MHPAKEVEKLRGAVERAQIENGKPFRRKLPHLRQELQVPVGLFAGGATTVRLLVEGTPVWELTIDVAGNEIRSGAVRFPLPSQPWPRPWLRLFLDGSVIEAFIGAREALTSRVYTVKSDATELEVAYTGKGKLAVELWPLDAISTDRLTT